MRIVIHVRKEGTDNKAPCGATKVEYYATDKYREAMHAMGMLSRYGGREEWSGMEWRYCPDCLALLRS